MAPHPWADPDVEPDLSLTFEQPEKWLNSNDRLHHMARARLTKYWRDLATVKGRQVSVPHLQRAHIVVTFHKPTKRIYDPANLYPTAKACVDGLVTAGLLPDDNYRHLVGPDMRYGEPGKRYFTVDIFELSTP